MPQRTHKVNPVMQSRDAATQRRRDMFFRRVQKERDDKKWQARGEQVCVNGCKSGLITMLTGLDPTPRLGFRPKTMGGGEGASSPRAQGPVYRATG